MKTSRLRRRSGGFTLMEVLLVLAILMILAGLAVVAIGPIKRNADRRAAKIQIKAYEDACEMYRTDLNVLPGSLQDLLTPPSGASDADLDKGSWPYLKGKIQKDPWGSEYKYEVLQEGKNEVVHISSFGPDRVEGNEDDITNI